MPYTAEQLSQIRSIDLLTYLRRYEPHSIRKTGSREYTLTEYDSLKISNGKWYRFSKGVGGASALLSADSAQIAPGATSVTGSPTLRTRRRIRS